MKKTKKRLIIWISVICALVILGYVGYTVAIDYAGTKAIDMMVENQLGSMLDSGEITIEELEEIITEPTAEEESPSAEEDASAPQAEPKKTPAAQQKPKTKQETVKAATKKVTETVTYDDKEAMMQLIASRLTAADVKYLSGLIAGGLDGEEISKAYKIAKSRFSKEELAKVREYWHRYKSMVVKKKPKTEEKK